MRGAARGRAHKDEARSALPGLRFDIPNEKQKREKKPAMKNDPKLVAAARELRDRWLEEVNAGMYLPAAHGKYDVSRRAEAPRPRAFAATQIQRPALPDAQAA